MADRPHESDQDMRRRPPAVDWTGVRRVHLMGICGSAMGALAIMLRKLGLEVRGSDQGAYPPMSTALAEAGVPVMTGYEADNLAWGPDVVVVGNVIRPTYPEAVALRARRVPHCSLPQALAALFIGERHSVVITGTHGKTTTASMTAWLLHQAGLDPGFMIGGVTGNFRSNHRVSDGPVFVVEGDEYDTAYFDKGPKFVHYRPRTASLNNVEFDHADIFADLAAVTATFERFVRLLPQDGRLLVNAADPAALTIARDCPAPLWTFGIEREADVRARDVLASADGTRFSLELPGEPPRPAELRQIWGDHNIQNALTAAGLAFAAGGDARSVVEALATFELPRKRQELIGVVRDVPVIDDFAHHPSAIRETLASIRRRYPERDIVALFEVESNTSRRRVFQGAFAQALATADHVYFCRPLEKTSDSLRPEERLDMDQLVADIVGRGTPAELISDVAELTDTVAGRARPGRDVIVAMSGRNFHGIHRRLLDVMNER